MFKKEELLKEGNELLQKYQRGDRDVRSSFSRKTDESDAEFTVAREQWNNTYERVLQFLEYARIYIYENKRIQPQYDEFEEMRKKCFSRDYHKSAISMAIRIIKTCY